MINELVIRIEEFFALLQEEKKQIGTYQESNSHFAFCARCYREKGDKLKVPQSQSRVHRLLIMTNQEDFVHSAEYVRLELCYWRKQIVLDLQSVCSNYGCIRRHITRG